MNGKNILRLSAIVSIVLLVALSSKAAERINISSSALTKVSVDQKTDSSAFGLWFSLNSIDAKSEIDRAILTLGSGLEIKDSSGEFVWVEVVFGLDQVGLQTKSAVESKRSDTLRTYGILIGDNNKSHAVDVTELLQEVRDRGASKVCFFVHSENGLQLLRTTKSSSEAKLSIAYSQMAAIPTDTSAADTEVKK